VWVQPRSIRDRRSPAAATLVVWLYLITANTDTDRAMRLLDDLLDRPARPATTSPTPTT
jgi:hypothetical protein